MQSIQNTGPQRESAALNRGLLGLFSKPGEKSSGGAESFSREVERAVERQGGRDAIEARSQEVASSKHSKRRSTFGGPSDTSKGPRTKKTSEDPQTAAGLVPIEHQVRPAENRRAAQPRVDEGAREARNTEGPATSGAESGSNKSSSGTAQRAPEAATPAVLDAPVAAGIPIAQPAAAGAPAAASATLQVQPTRAPQGVDASQAFVDAAKSKEGAPAKTPVAATGSTPDPKLIEHAEKVLRQIRVNLHPGMKEITLNLNPVDLGRLSIDLRVGEGGLTAVVRAESKETLELLKHQAPELRAVLAQQGIETEQMEFKLAFDASGSQQGGASEEAFQSKPRAHRAKEPSVSPPTSPAPRVSNHRDDGGIDTLA